MEVRGCDCGSLPMIAALAPFCHGLLYDEQSRAAATALTAGLDWDARQKLADEVPTSGLATRVGKTTVGELSRELVAIARDGLKRTLPGVLRLIEPVAHIAETGRTQADAIIDIWNTHAGDVPALVRALAHPGLHPTTGTKSDLSC
jgi:glutamate--cysteine ligase